MRSRTFANETNGHQNSKNIYIILFTLLFGDVASISLKFTSNSMDNEWELYKKSYNKVYKDDNEELLRRVIWEDNVRFIEHHNMAADRGEHSYWLGINHFADMSEKEVTRKMKGYKMSHHVIKDASLYLPPNNVQVPDEVDWRQKGYVTPVKDQVGILFFYITLV
ncbi:Hypothetical predicted protein [Mytilus galloprovincialis]|uniref:Cathepsin propeptide inhibitor domain-containing protein n=1 Tax=Mytilus galloprovincialis TaxID=29158 RepID=A0A8B6DUI7_MYTGA|nr:Hypothetical predicted protein [Mytilus galloprovincialis]